MEDNKTVLSRTTLNEEFSTTRSLLKINQTEINSLVELSRNKHKDPDSIPLLNRKDFMGEEGGLRINGYFKFSLSMFNLLQETLKNIDCPYPQKTLTVITVAYNCEIFIEKTIQSVLKQNDVNIEYIIIDGGSSDGTVDILKKYNNAINYWVSEKDDGIYDAMNKGIRASLGDYIHFLNAGDVLVDDAVEKIYSSFESCSLVYKFLVKTENDLIRKERATPLYLARRMLNHQGIIYSREALKNQFDSNFEIAGDFKHLLELKLWKKIEYIDLHIVDYLGGGAATTQTAIYKNWMERLSVPLWKKVGIIQSVIVLAASLLGIVINFIKIKIEENK